MKIWRALLILGIGLAIIWACVQLGKIPSSVFLPTAHAGDMNLSWTAPTGNCNNTPLTDLQGYRVRWGMGVAELPASATSYVIPNLLPGRWWVNVAAYNSSNNESQYVAAWKDVAAGDFTVTTPTVYTLVKGVNKFVLLPVGTVALGTQCLPDQTVNGYYVVPRASVTWSGTVRPDVVVAQCG